MKTSDLVIAANTIWVVQRGGTQGSPTSPLLLRVPSPTDPRLRSGKARLRQPTAALGRLEATNV